MRNFTERDWISLFDFVLFGDRRLQSHRLQSVIALNDVKTICFFFLKRKKNDFHVFITALIRSHSRLLMTSIAKETKKKENLLLRTEQTITTNNDNKK